MKVCTCKIVGVSPLSFGAPIRSTRDTGEAHDHFEERTWRERAHVDESGELFIPPQALKNTLANCAKFLSESIPGKGKATYTKNFKAGTMVTEPMMLGVKLDAVVGERLFVPSDGRSGGGSRVWKVFPTLPKWSTTATLILLDPILIGKPEKVEEYMRHAGSFIGLLRFRPQNGGYYGRFKIEDFKCKDMG